MESPQYTPAQVNQLPDEPGVYKFHNKDGGLIYVGKAKSLKKRVSSYFNKQNAVNRKTLKLVSEIEFLEFTLVNSEFDALLLENNLIKANQPKYNILLKDDKTYPYLCVLKERFPRVISTRKMEVGSGSYYGPFANVRAMNMVLDLIKKLFTLRNCNLALSEESIRKKKFKVCLEYHIGNCKGPCENLQSEEEYNKEIEQVEHILKGNLAIPRNFLNNKMRQAAERLEFELANQYKIKLDLLEMYQAKSQVVNPNLGELNVFTIVSDEKQAFVNFLCVNNGNIIQTKTIEIKKKLEETDSEILLLTIIEMTNSGFSKAKEILTNIDVEEKPDRVNLSNPKIGDKRKLVELSLKNALFHKKERLSQEEVGKVKEDRILSTLQNDLQLKNLPKHIECFDNSNLQGTNPVASMVCFKMGKPSKKDYRKFNIKTVVGPDDFASMHEIITRRYSRLLEEKLPLPNLIIVDGGKGQLSVACEALKELKIYGQVPIVGIAKRLEEIYYPEDSFPLHIAKKSESLKLIQRIRDEAHRFAITFHRQKRSKNSLVSALEEMEGIGEKTVDKLLSKYKSIKNIKLAPIDELSALIGKERALTLKDKLK